jgi:prepilin-type N-terminal cleavage/methylation domain-containing protein
MQARTHRRGFTIPELLTVVAIFFVLASLAVVAVGRSMNASDLDGFATHISVDILEARRRAISSMPPSTYLVDLRPTSVSFCQLPPGAVVQTTCPSTAPLESSPVIQSGAGAGAGAQLRYFATTVDRGGGGVAQLAPPAPIYLRPDGTATVTPNLPVPTGATLYLQGYTMVTGGGTAPDPNAKRKIVVFPAGARPRTSDTW